MKKVGNEQIVIIVGVVIFTLIGYFFVSKDDAKLGASTRNPEWVAAHEVPRFDSLTGNLEVGEYALMPNGMYLANVPTTTILTATSTVTNKVSTTSVDIDGNLINSLVDVVSVVDVPSSYEVPAHLEYFKSETDLIGFTKVNHIGKRYFDIYEDGVKTIRQEKTKTDFDLDIKRLPTRELLQ